MAATSHTWPPSTLNTARMTGERNTHSYLILINLNLNNHKWQMATLLDGTGLRK